MITHQPHGLLLDIGGRPRQPKLGSSDPRSRHQLGPPRLSTWVSRGTLDAVSAHPTALALPHCYVTR
jgi:hypothetical protein